VQQRDLHSEEDVSMCGCVGVWVWVCKCVGVSVSVSMYELCVCMWVCVCVYVCVGGGWVGVYPFAGLLDLRAATHSKKTHEKPMPCGTIEPLPQVVIY